MILPTSLLGRNALTIAMTAGDLWPLGMLFVDDCSMSNVYPYGEARAEALMWMIDLEETSHRS